MPQSDEKLQKVLARQGFGSRREMEQVISDGRVTVNGEVAKLGDRVSEKDQLLLDGKPVRSTKENAVLPRVLLYHKPEGEICSRKDPEGRRSVYDRLPKLKGQRWISVGRLDYNTSGLLLFTTDGELANKLMHPSTQIEREYLCRVMGPHKEANLQALVDGVMLEDGEARFTDIVDGGGEGINRWYYVVIMEGRNREVRRLWESQGLQVNRLKRVRYGSVFLPSKIKQGQWEEMAKADAADVYRMADMSAPKKMAQPLRQAKTGGGKSARENTKGPKGAGSRRR